MVSKWLQGLGLQEFLKVVGVRVDRVSKSLRVVGFGGSWYPGLWMFMGESGG